MTNDPEDTDVRAVWKEVRHVRGGVSSISNEEWAARQELMEASRDYLEVWDGIALLPHLRERYDRALAAFRALVPAKEEAPDMDECIECGGLYAVTDLCPNCSPEEETP